MEKVLIVDDEAFICENLQRILGEEHYDTTAAQSGEAALESLRRNHVDLVFLDLNLPDMHGFDILKHIKGVDPDLLVIVCILHDGELILEPHLPRELADPREWDPKERFPVDFVIPPEGINLEQVVDQFTQALIERVMKMVNGNISHAAKLLGIPRGTLRYKIEKLQAESTWGLAK